MAMSITMADNNDVDPFLGANVNVAYTDAMKDDAGLMAEAYICSVTRYDAVTNWATLDAIAKVIYTEYVARLIAVQGIAYDMSGFTSRIEAEDMINIHMFRLKILDKLIIDQKTSIFIQ